MGSRAEEEFVAPNAQRVARRALIMSAMICRAFIDDDEEQSEFAESIKTWVNRSGLIPELEPEEKKILDAPLGVMTRQERISWTWRSEGLIVLAWALGRVDYPPHDECIDPEIVAETLGFLSNDSRAFVKSAQLLDEDQVIDQCEKIFAVHWRLRQFSVDRRAINFPKVANEAWFGPIDIRPLRLIDRDLAIGGVSIAKAPAEAVKKCESIARERHCGANWLVGYHAIYSEVDPAL